MLARLVADPEALDRQVRVDVAQGVGAALEEVVVVRETGIKLIAEFSSDQTGRRGVDGQFGEEVQQFDLAGIAPTLDGASDLALDGGGMTFHMVATQCGVVQHLLSAFRARVEYHPLSEDRRHERICLRLVEVFVGGAEEELVRLRTGEQDDLLVGELEGADVAALVAHPLHQGDRVGTELGEVSVFVGTPGDAAHFVERRAGCHGSSGYFSCWRSLGASVSGASGCSSIEATNPPRGVSATNAMALARSAARRK